ncbi:hypothetical protein ACG83_09155 [Frankia sp. R43]|uniref:recombinase family protein n=1 Tax=Frankia sp. R43 TaxID=269536 RepID=UPI0006CA2C25|nr:recombinase family protein [Frankia sp. R43]KPM55486.1 hypothetical protein ACG83_09155 [Frankia sp. R43]
MSADAPRDTPPDAPPDVPVFMPFGVPPDPEPAFGYERLSRDRDGQRRRVEEQRADIEEHSPRLGYDVLRHFVDNSVSASKYDVDRPGFDSLCDALRTTGVKVLLVTEITRISRQDETGGAFMGLMTRIKGKVVKVPEGTTYDFADPDSRNRFRQELHDAIRESEKVSERVTKSHARLRERQRWTGGPAPYGWRREPYTVQIGNRHVVRFRWHVEETEGTHVEAMFAAINRGQSRNTIARDLNLAGVKPRRGDFWTDGTITAIVTNPRACGLYAVKVDGVWEIPDVQPEEQQFPPIVDYATWSTAQDVIKGQIKNPNRVNPHDGVNETAGLFRCAACQQPLYRNQSKSKTTSYIRHPAKGRARPCPANHKLTVSYDETWEYVGELIDRFVLSAPLRRRTAEARDFDAELAKIESDLKELNAEVDKGLPLRLAGIRAESLEQKEREIKLARDRVRAGEKPVISLGVAATWRSLPYEEIRNVIFGVFKYIDITPGTQGWGPWDRRRFTPHFTEELSPALNDLLVDRAPGWDRVAAWLRGIKEDPDAPRDAAGELALSDSMVERLLYWASMWDEDSDTSPDASTEADGRKRDFFAAPYWAQGVLKSQELRRRARESEEPMYDPEELYDVTER